MMWKKNRRRKKQTKRAEKLTFGNHIKELRSRIIFCIISIFIGTLIGYFLRNQIISILIRPLNQTVFYTSPTGGFSFIFSISLLFGFLISLPMIIYQTIKFIEPALPEKVPNLFFLIFITSILLMITGISFAYFISLPAALFFLNSFSSIKIKALISADEYFSFIIHYLFGFGIVFQLPLIVLAINKIKKLKIKDLLKYERHVIAISFIVAAILTPTPDVLNQTILALPLILLYQVTILFLWLINNKKIVRIIA